MEPLESWHQYSIAAQNVVLGYGNQDPEQTIMVQLMIGDAALVGLGVMLVRQIYPELAERVEAFQERLLELGDVQGFWKPSSDEGATTDES